MFFAALGIFLCCDWYLPWWGLALVAAAMGGLGANAKGHRQLVTPIVVASGVALAALSFLQDGRSYGMISRRMGALFGLPSPALIFLLMFMIGALTALFSYQSGALLRNIIVGRSNT